MKKLLQQELVRMEDKSLYLKRTNFQKDRFSNARLIV
jgi:hypothetical protein